ncbi:Ig-like domain-containing protein [Collinsella tanakaei]|nr:Ig-like domain-containing protein [Collinsella tanakaei]
MRKFKFLAVGFAAALLTALPVAGFADEPQGIVVGEDAAGVEVQIGEPAVLEDTGISLQWSSAASDDHCYIKGTFDYKEASYQKVLVNKHREANGASPLVMDADLQSAAMQRAAEIALYFSHTRPNGTKWSTITQGAYGENIAIGGFGSSDAAENVTDTWMNSDGHRANILDPSYAIIGVGCFRIGSVSCWVELFGTAHRSETYADAGVFTAITKVDYSHSLVPYDGSGFNLNMRQEDPEPLEPGETYELVVGIRNPEFSYIYTSTEARGYTWRSSNPAAFTVDNGIVSVSSGAQVGATSTIAATSPGGRSWSKEFIVKSNVVSVTGVRLNRTSLSLDTGDTAVLTATVSPSNATDKGVSWSSSNTGVATVDRSGNVRAVGAGTAVITVRTDDGSYTAKCTVTVKSDVKVERISLSPSTLTLGKNSTYKLTYTISPSNAENKGVTWKSSDSSVARVDSTGRVTAVSVGKATITVTTADGGKTASCTVTVKGPAVTGVSLDRAALTLNKGDIRTLKATVYPTDAENREVGWTSSNSAIARVDSSGKVIAVSAGKATITVTTRDGGKTATCVVTVKGSAVTGVSLDRTSLSLGKGESYTLKATIAPTDAENKEVIWKSTDSSIARVDSNGNVTAVASGKVTITATTDDGGKTASCTVTVKGPAVTGVSLDKTTLSLGKGESYTLKATVAPADAENKKVTWTSSDTKVATVDSNGKVTAVAPGSATITVTAEGGGKTATCAVSVAGAVSGVTLDKTSLSLDKGESYTLKATVTPADAENKKVTWRSSDTKVATVDANGKVTAVAPGSATIIVTTEDGNKTATCAVSVAGAVSGVTLNKTELALKVDESVVLKATVLPENALNKKVTWKSSDTKVATVDANGKVAAVAPGTATITVTTEDGNKTATCMVKVGDQLVITFVTNGGTAVKSQVVNEGERAVRPADPTRAYYRFTGWFTDASLRTAYDFAQPVKADLTLYAGWAGYSPYRGFTDVASDDWYVTCGLFDYAVDHRFMSGYSGTTLFGPYDTITRAQVICVLWNMAGQPSAGSVENFSDNRDTTVYYYDAVRWARSAGVANGYAGSNLFNPNGNVSRQELATFLYNYANKVAKLDTSSDMGAASQISGWSTVDAYAKPAIAWAVDHGLMSGVDTPSGPQLRPNDTAWRASMATMSATFHRDVIGG